MPPPAIASNPPSGVQVCSAADDAAVPSPSGQPCGDLLRLLAGCCHPRAERLRAQIDASPSASQISNLREEVLRLLTVCYGPAEARRQVDELTWH